MSNHAPPQLDSSGLTQDQIDDLEARFSGWQSAINFCCLPAGLAFALLTHWLLELASRWFLNHDGVAGFKIPYQPEIWWFFPGFGAALLSYEISLQVWSAFVGRDAIRLYTQWNNRQPKPYRGRFVSLDSRGWLRKLALLFCLPILGISVLALNMHSAFGGDGVYEFGFAFARPVFHRYSELRRIAVVTGYFAGRNDDWIGKASVVLDFADGHRWEQSTWDPARLSANLDHISKILREKSPLEFVWANSVETLGRL